MLRITTVGIHTSSPIIKLEGKLLEPWVGEVRRVCAELSASSNNLRLDLAALTFVDAAGMCLLRELRQAHVVLVGCSVFVAALLQGKQS